MDKNEIAEIVRNVIDEATTDRGKKYFSDEKAFPVSVSNRHIHISREHLYILFGENYSLENIRDLSQPGQFACREKLTVAGPKGVISGVRILGPERPKTQVEISITDSYKLGVPVSVRDSGDLDGTPGLTLVGPCGSVMLDCGVIVAKRHIHMTSADAVRFGVKDKDIVNVRIDGERGGVFSDVLVRVSDSYALDMHIDTDEGNAFMIRPGQSGVLIT